MPNAFEETRRIHLGRITLSSSPPSNPPSDTPPAAFENVYEFVIGPSTKPGYINRFRFSTLELVVAFGGDRTSGEIIPWFSRVNPAPLDRSTVAESAADTWGSPGAQSVVATPTTAAGNIIETSPRGTKFVYLQQDNLDGTTGDLVVDVYGMMSAVGGLGF